MYECPIDGICASHGELPVAFFLAHTKCCTHSVYQNPLLYCLYSPYSLVDVIRTSNASPLADASLENSPFHFEAPSPLEHASRSILTWKIHVYLFNELTGHLRQCSANSSPKRRSSYLCLFRLWMHSWSLKLIRMLLEETSLTWSPGRLVCIELNHFTRWGLSFLSR